MSALFHDMGFMRYPLTFSLLVVLVLSGWTATRLWSREAVADLRTKAWVDAILFWGGFAMVVGFLGTVIGIVLAAQSIEMAGEVSTRLVWGGIKIAMLTSAMGAVILALSGLSWFGLTMRWKLLRADAVAAA